MLARTPWVKPLRIAPKPARYRLHHVRQVRLIDEVANILKLGEPTYFAFEGACRHALRKALVLKGWPWPDADKAAGEVVRVALERVGAQRPTWLQGQPGWTEPGAYPIERTNCARCRKPLPGDRPKYCSDHCRRGAQDERQVEQRSAERLAERILCDKVGAKR